ncbi:MAG: GTP cyclohydrolase FolE2 [Candidatus Marinimicrobia bacterium]|nr:GTP cyclohydrolase FolE2 [Candidatus Neomarinimicrobiota bacterium]
MQDIQNQFDSRNIPIDQVGVKDLTYPIVLLDRENEVQQTVARINMYVDLPHDFRGTHMSRFVEILNEHHQRLKIDTIEEVLRKMKSRLKAEKAHIEMFFPYFLEKKAPVSRARSMTKYECSFTGELDGDVDLVLGVKVPVTTLCPCSKEIAEEGAHNQRSIISIQVRYSELVWIEELIEIAEKSASSPVYSLLKREDEKYVTEKAYKNPKFVEDVVRNLALELDTDQRIFWYKVESENFESIHNHSAYARIEKHKDK